MAESVATILFENQRVLLIKRRDIPVWVLPGGGIDPGETPEAAACREMEEETGCRVEIVRKIALYTPKNRLARFTHFYEVKLKDGFLKTGNERGGCKTSDIQKIEDFNANSQSQHAGLCCDDEAIPGRVGEESQRELAIKWQFYEGQKFCNLLETLDLRFFSLDDLPKLLPPPYAHWIADAAARHPDILKKEVEGVSYAVLIKLLLQHPILVGRFLLTKVGIHLNK